MRHLLNKYFLFHLFVLHFFFATSGIANAQTSIDLFSENSLRQNEYQSIVVAKVKSADTLILENDKKIRLIGLVAPQPPPSKEIQRDQYGLIIEDVKPTSTIEERSLDYAKRLLEGKKVRLEFDVESKDADFRTLAYAFLPDGTLANAEILRQGYANLRITPPNTKYADILRKAYQEAKKEKRGLQDE